MQTMTKSKSEVFRRFVTPRRFMRGASVSVDACGVSRDVLIATLRRTELLCNMPDDMADVLLDSMVGRRIRKGAVLFREGSRGDSLVLKASGTAQVLQLRSGLANARVLATLTEPAVLGQESFYGVDKRSVTVRMLTEGTVFHIRRGLFADLVASGFVHWVGADETLLHEKNVVWIGEARTRPRAMQGTACVSIDHLKRYVRETSFGETIYCCSRDDTIAAFAAFLFAQRGLDAIAVRNGRKASLLNRGADQE